MHQQPNVSPGPARDALSRSAVLLLDPSGSGSASGRPARDTAPRDGARGVSPDPDRETVALAASGDRAAFETLLRRHYDRMHRIAWRMTGSVHDAEDVVQDVCCGLVGKLATFKGESRFTTWLFGAVVNACHDHRRRGATLTRMKEGLAVWMGLARPADGRDLYRRTWLASALATLEPALRDTVVLVVGEGLTHAEAGIALGVAEATISWRMSEVRRRLGDALGQGETA